MKEISVSFLTKEEPTIVIEKINNSNADYLHFDVMDGKFVKNRFLTIKQIKEYLNLTNKKKDIHLMVKNPKRYIKSLKNLDIDYITIHYETKNYLKNIKLLKDNNIKVGLSIKPETSVEEIFPLLKDLDLVLIMSVNPGASGQEFIKESTNKINKLKKEIKRSKLNTKISIDGGVNDNVLKEIKNVDIIVSSSFVLKDLNNINILKNIK